MTPAERFEHFASFADRPGDGDEEKLKHRFLVMAGLLMSGGGVLWGSMAVAAGLPVQSLIPYGYVGITAINFTVLNATKDFARARLVQQLISLLLPFLFQWVLGGFIPSGCVMIWSMLALIGSLTFEDIQTNARWLGLFLLLTAGSAVIDPFLPVPASIAGSGLAPVFFAINVCVVSSVVFGLTLYFVRQRHSAMVELAQKNQQIAAGQQALIQSEKMAALGQLVAGVAHELNTPLGSIRAAVGNLATALQAVLQDLPVLLAGLDPEERSRFDALVAQARAGSPMTTREERSARRSLRKALDEAGVEEADHVAALLVDMGVSGDIAPHLPLLLHADKPTLLQAAYDVVAVQRNRENIGLASERAAKIVFALKSYAHPGHEGEDSDGRITDALDTVITLYRNQIKQGVELEKQYDDPGELAGRHDELNQVWTNLVHNALQAMEHKGTLTLKVSGDADQVVVAVADTGPGIPEAARARIFEPFYTTKPTGEGSGLGLSICKEIVDRHGGTLSFDTSSSGTTFTVTLPRNHRDADA